MEQVWANESRVLRGQGSAGGQAVDALWMLDCSMHGVRAPLQSIWPVRLTKVDRHRTLLLLQAGEPGAVGGLRWQRATADGPSIHQCDG